MGKDSYALVTGLFMAVLISGIIVIIIWLSGVQGKTRTYTAETRGSVTGLKSGSIIYYRGIDVGKVKHIEFDANRPELITVTMEIDKNIQFTKGIYATLEMKGVTGLTQIALKDDGTNPELLEHSQSATFPIPIKPSLLERLTLSGEQTIEQARDVMTNVNLLLSEQNLYQVEQILLNIETATLKLHQLQDSADKTLAEFPSLTNKAHASLQKINTLADEFTLLSQQLRQHMTILSGQTGELMLTGTAVGQQLLQTTLPRINTLIMQLQSTTRRFDRVGVMIESEPQMFLFGSEALQPAPGEPGFKEAK